MASEALPVCEIGIIGGTGVYGLQGMVNKREVRLNLHLKHLPLSVPLRLRSPRVGLAQNSNKRAPHQ